jgi:two-component system response regulator FixJ
METEQRVFIVDDDEAVRESLAALLISYGYAAVTFPSALHFLARCDRNASGCLIADVRMPDMDGLELQERQPRIFPIWRL